MRNFVGGSMGAVNVDSSEYIRSLFDSLLQSSHDAIQVSDGDNRCILINPAFKELMGLTEQEVVGEPAYIDIISGRISASFIPRNCSNLSINSAWLKAPPINIPPRIISKLASRNNEIAFNCAIRGA